MIKILKLDNRFEVKAPDDWLVQIKGERVTIKEGTIIRFSSAISTLEDGIMELDHNGVMIRHVQPETIAKIRLVMEMLG